MPKLSTLSRRLINILFCLFVPNFETRKDSTYPFYTERHCTVLFEYCIDLYCQKSLPVWLLLTEVMLELMNIWLVSTLEIKSLDANQQVKFYIVSFPLSHTISSLKRRAHWTMQPYKHEVGLITAEILFSIIDLFNQSSLHGCEERSRSSFIAWTYDQKYSNRDHSIFSSTYDVGQSGL